MSLRKILFVPILAAGTAGPYVAMDDSWQQWAAQQREALWSGSAATGTTGELPGAELGGTSPHAASSPWQAASAASSPAPADAAGTLPAARVTPLEQALRFDVHPTWVLGNWPRVSQVRSSDGYPGMRVPLVTGTKLEDISGSLTFYFDSQQRVQRLSLHGFTGDPRNLVQLAVRHLGLQPESNHGAGMYVRRWNGEPTSALRISHAAVASRDNAYARYLVELEVNNPATGYRLSPEFQQVLQHDALTQRWPAGL